MVSCAIFASDTLGGRLARRLLPLFGTLVLVVGWLRIVGERAGLYGAINGVNLPVDGGWLLK